MLVVPTFVQALHTYSCDWGAADKQGGPDAAQLADIVRVDGDASELQVTTCPLYCVLYRMSLLLWCTVATKRTLIKSGLLSMLPILN